MSPPVLERVRSVIHKARNAARLRRRSTISSNFNTQKQSIWKRLPDSVLVKILTQCEVQDIYSLLLSCRILRRRISHLEYAISQAYLRHRTRPDRRTTEETDSCELVPSVGDDLTFIAGLFPPPPPQYSTSAGAADDLPEYSFGYLADLTRCWKTCVRLSYYLAEYVVYRHLRNDSSSLSSSKTEQEVVYSKSVGLLQSRLLSSLAYIIFFLETYASTESATRSAENAYLVESQQSILQQPPFNNTQILLSTHHAMHLLCSSVRQLMAPDIAAASTETWLGLLLTTSTLERIVEFFVAAATDESAKATASAASGHWTNRMEFMWQMRRDWGEFVASGVLSLPQLRDVWFEAARREICRRGAIPHESEELVSVLHRSGVALRCEFCEE
ncbi:hypothetical protein BDV26DRAFT_173178 [Aspergillus bertholletiae]|uniref:F-box domain-containing protein n=1 Tax=Aspergillus bertholletiae TaxID=1226010 RepID=A0A5N7BBR0_9EURO|nr:hypothetical protein BDV26DRAFT_173178 [Aspergillus bertholletiae]